MRPALPSFGSASLAPIVVLLLPALATLSLGGCQKLADAPSPGPAPALVAGQAAPAGALAVTHGGVGSPPDWSPQCQVAAQAALAAMTRTAAQAGQDAALAGALAGTVVLEDDPTFNAGTGANIRLDGKTIQMDAALMTGDGRFAAVAVIENVRNPILVARAVLDTPHRLLAGDGATRFAHAMGFADVVPTCPQAEAKYGQRRALLLAGKAGGGYDTFDWRRAWNFPEPLPDWARGRDGAAEDAAGRGTGAGARPGDTVGTVTRAADGTFAVTVSTGGTSITLDGRVGDVPIYGCGSYAGPAGAVACTGHGEEIIRKALARAVYALMADGLSARQAVARAVADFPAEWSVGVIAVDRNGWGVAANMVMAHGVAGE